MCKKYHCLKCGENKIEEFPKSSPTQCRACLRQKKRLYLATEEGRKKRRETNNKYRAENLGYFREYHNKRSRTDPSFRLAHNLRSRINRALKKIHKPGSAVKDLGCSLTELKIYIESLWKDGMTWENYGQVWEIDHIIALALFDLTVEQDFKKACHYSNLQPLFKTDHYKKTLQDLQALSVIKL